MEKFVQLRVDVERDLKRRVFVYMAQRDMKFSTWLREQLKALVERPDQPKELPHDLSD